MTKTAEYPQSTFVPPAPTRTVSVGRRLSSAPLPQSVSRARSAAKKLVWTAFEARLVTTPVRYAYRELVAPQTGDYTLRHSGGHFSLRHRSGDVDIFRKFYAYGYYAWPSDVTAHLQRLNRPLHVLDLGANIGFFDVHAREQLPIGSVVCFEPDPDNARVLERVRVANGANWEIVRACASNQGGQVMFKSGRQNFSQIASDGDFSVPCVDVMPYIAEADLIKMNIEGSEWEILEDPRLADTSGAWIVEYHRIRNPERDITDHVQSLFHRAGYTTQVAVCHQNNGLVWAWKDPEPRLGPGAPLPADL